MDQIWLPNAMLVNSVLSQGEWIPVGIHVFCPPVCFFLKVPHQGESVLRLALNIAITSPNLLPCPWSMKQKQFVVPQVACGTTLVSHSWL